MSVIIDNVINTKQFNNHNLVELSKLTDSELLERLEFPFDGDGSQIVGWLDKIGLFGYAINLNRTAIKNRIRSDYDYDMNTKYDLCERLFKLITPYMRKTKEFSLKCPEKGEFYGYKFVKIDRYNYLNGATSCDIGIAKLKIPEDSKRTSSFLGVGKCRCHHAKVEQIDRIHAIPVHYISGRNEYIFTPYNTGDPNIDTAKIAYSYFIDGYKYRVGCTFFSDKVDMDPWTECSNGIHFFMTWDEAFNFAKATINKKPFM